MKKYYGTIKRCNDYYAYTNNQETYYIGDCQFGNIDFGYVADVITIESTGEILYEISSGIFVRENDYKRYKAFPSLVDLNLYKMGTYPTEKRNEFVDQDSLEKVKVRSLFRR